MRPLEFETNSEVLREFAKLLQLENEELRRDNKRLLQLTESDTQVRLTNLEDKLVKLREQFFGSGQEKLEKDSARPVGHKDEQLKLHTKLAHYDEVEDGRKLQAEGKVPSTATYACTEEQLLAASRELGIRDEVGARAWREAKGLFQESRQITIFERVYAEILVRQKKYRLRGKYNKTGKDEVLITAPGPVKIKPGTKYSAEFAIATVVDKYCDHIPLERQRRRMERAGFNVDVKTLYSLCEGVAELCEEVLPGIKKDIQSDFCAVHVDESPWPIIGDKKKNYMWVMSNRLGSYYQFEPSRSGKVGEELLRGYEGAVVSDAYGGYKRIKSEEGQRLAHCWAHARRDFYNLRKNYPEECVEILELMGELFAIECEAQTFEELRKLRQEKSAPQCEKIFDWLVDRRTKYLGAEEISKAINYCLKHWQELTLFLTDLSVPLTNNDAERALRHIVVGRKNFGGSKTINGADVAATLYTVIESCKRVGVEPSDYLQYLVNSKWHREKNIQTPLQYSLERFGSQKSTVFPAKDDWKIPAQGPTHA